MALQDGVCVPSQTLDFEVFTQIDEGTSQSGGYSSLLAEEAMVPLGNEPQCVSPSQDSGVSSSSLPREVCSSSSSQAEPTCFDVEREKFQPLRCSANVILTLLKARKPSTNYVYSKIWNKVKVFVADKCLDPIMPLHCSWNFYNLAWTLVSVSVHIKSRWQ